MILLQWTVMNKEKYMLDLLESSEFLKTLRDNNSALIIDLYGDWTINAKLRVEKTDYTFWAKEIEWWWTIEPMIMPLKDPEWRSLVVHIIPFNGVLINK